MKLRKHKVVVSKLPNTLDLLALSYGYNQTNLGAAERTCRLMGTNLLAHNRSPKRHARFRHSLTVITLRSV